MTDQPLVNEVTDIKAVVFKQFRLKWQEVGKSAATTAFVTAMAVVAPSIYAMEWPTSIIWHEAWKVGIYTLMGTLLRYVFKPTTTVIKGQVDPQVTIKAPDTVITTDANNS